MLFSRGSAELSCVSAEALRAEEARSISLNTPLGFNVFNVAHRCLRFRGMQVIAINFNRLQNDRRNRLSGRGCPEVLQISGGLHVCRLNTGAATCPGGTCLALALREEIDGSIDGN